MTGQEFNALVDAQADALYRFLLKSTKDESTAQDLVQDAFAKLWEKHKTVDGQKAKSYLFSAGYHSMIDYFRKRKRISLYDELPEDSYHYEQEYTGTAEMLETALNQLPVAQRSVVLLCDYEGYSYKEIEDITGLTEPQVKVYIHRARKRLRDYLKKTEAYECIQQAQ